MRAEATLKCATVCRSVFQYPVQTKEKAKEMQSGPVSSNEIVGVFHHSALGLTLNGEDWKFVDEGWTLREGAGSAGSAKCTVFQTKP